ncbi:PEP-CTERM sorting domain-containing protein [Desmonostoc muscorum LEGE 12446]|uniref:PEP-CTERM sorting domain-containing protein n=1 Tax=Desmonostoc muscorum LEGE 12446 TaxID=1828758 RepID=A0A8J6ZWE9_DESMC|nr:PEP-CTERM sorting domain-containing protein [Desmonostoc muscorum]MCF2152304.1 PEP-CTERM sorting domain-containing protein [Desmonostoc muscorum LEGE 12446]
MNISPFIKHSTFKIGLISLASLGSLAIASTSALAVGLNLSSWQQFGDVTTSADGANLSNASLEFADDAPASAGTFNYSGISAGNAGFTPDLQDFLGLADLSALDIGGFAYEGSAIKNTVTVAAGEALSFDWNFRTNETLNKDFAFLLVDSTVIKLADFTDATQPSSPFLQETGIRSYTFTTPGTYTLAFGVVDVDDYGTTSALEVKNATIKRVAEPSTILGLVTALGFGATMGRLRKKMSTYSSLS